VLLLPTPLLLLLLALAAGCRSMLHAPVFQPDSCNFSNWR
jgi:hypothetical protein